MNIYILLSFCVWIKKCIQLSVTNVFLQGCRIEKEGMLQVEKEFRSRSLVYSIPLNNNTIAFRTLQSETIYI